MSHTKVSLASKKLAPYLSFPSVLGTLVLQTAAKWIHTGAVFGLGCDPNAF